MNYRRDFKDGIINRMFGYEWSDCNTDKERQIVEDMMEIVYEEYHKPLRQAKEGSLDYNDQNWTQVLDSLNLEDRGADAYGVTYLYEKNGNSTNLHYEDEDQKRELYIFLTGMLYQRLHDRYDVYKAE